MASDLKAAFLAELAQKFGGVRSLPGSQSLYELGEHHVRLYIRYSRLHERQRTFYGLRAEDLRQLEGRPSFICFLWDQQPEPLFLPFSDYEDVFSETSPAKDGQYKVQVYLQDGAAELYIARAGRFNVAGHMGWAAVDRAIHPSTSDIPSLSHSQVQTLLGSIGASKSHDVWIPLGDREALDWSLAGRFQCLRRLPYDNPLHLLTQEIDVLWIRRGSNELEALYEVEHSTPIYSGLLRFNDVRLAAPSTERFAIVSNDARRSLFVRQLKRPTFLRSGLSDLCAFLEYRDVFEWHKRVVGLEGGSL